LAAVPEIPDFAGRPLSEWTRDELEDLAARQRHDPPKVRELLDWMTANNVESMRDLEDEEVIAAARELRMTVFASPLDIAPHLEPVDGDDPGESRKPG
jgi:hypothetical protein